jgi:UDP-N-acetylglucosamine 4,6-dehydratase
MKSVLITGGTGSFGQAFAKRLLKDGTERVVILSRGEHAQAEMRERLSDDRLRFFIGDVRDRDRLRRAFEGVDVVVHAAALKRIEVGAYDPIEMVKTNVIGTMNVIEAAMDAKVKKVVGLSSDKAWQPISPYGQSKALAESLLLNANNISGKNGAKIFNNTIWECGGFPRLGHPAMERDEACGSMRVSLSPILNALASICDG